jgi:Mn-dependent DtxR family transcriptional regulator
VKDKIITILNNNKYAATWSLARQLKVKTSRCLMLMNLLESNGVVRRSEYSQRNNIVWALHVDEESKQCSK